MNLGYHLVIYPTLKLNTPMTKAISENKFLNPESKKNFDFPSNSSYEPLGVYRTILSLAFLVVGFSYLIWRHGTLGGELPIFSWALYFAEIYGFGTALLHIFMCWRLTVREPSLPAPGATVDVFVPTYNESVDIVRRTLLAARNMDYPHRTWLLDDGNRADMKALAERLDVNYLARTENTHAKAGNLNNALLQSFGEFIAIFDADHAPQKRFLTRTLGYFNDKSVAFVQTPQDFFNLDSYQHRLKKNRKKLWTEQSLFFKVIQRGKDYWNAAFFCGSCAVVRRSALISIGGFATETVTEDLHTSIRLHKAGFKSIYHAESLAFGIAPGSVAPFLKQRIRWGQGAMQVLKIENIFFTRKLTIAQRLNYLASIMTYFDGWQKGLFYFAPAFVLLTGILPITVDGKVFLAWFIPYYFLSFWNFEEIGRGYGGIFYIEQYNFARFAAFAWATLGLFRKNLRFSVTNKSLSRESEMRRMFMPQILLIFLNIAAIPIGIVLALTFGHLPHEALVFNLIWSMVNLSLGLAIFGYTKRTERYIRAEYRFPIPLLLVLHEAGRNLSLTIDNISSSGCRLYGRMPERAKKGSILSGSLLLPSGSLEIKAEIVSEIMAGDRNSGQYLKAVGCQFVWADPADQDVLELFLYGNDLQWLLLELEEKALTPIERFRQRIRYGKISRPADERWATCEVISEGGSTSHRLPGVIPLPVGGGAPKRVILFADVREGTLITINIYTRSGLHVTNAHITNSTPIDTSLGQVFILTLIPVANQGTDNSNLDGK